MRRKRQGMKMVDVVELEAEMEHSEEGGELAPER
jgi:hypothetical protein